MFGTNIICLILFSITFTIYSTSGIKHSLSLYNHQDENESTYQISTTTFGIFTMLDAWSHFEKYFTIYGPKRVCYVGTFARHIFTGNQFAGIMSSKGRECIVRGDNGTTLTIASYVKIGPEEISQNGVGFTIMPDSKPEDYPRTTYTADMPVFNETRVYRIWLFGSSPLTIYSNTNYTGVSMCLQPVPAEENSVFIGYYTSSLGLEMDFIKSFRFGCFSKNVYNSI